MRIRLAIPALFTAALFGQEAAIRGTVVEKTTGMPLAGIAVKLCYATGASIDSATTEASGTFRFAVTDAGAYRIEAEMSGFAEASSPVEVPETALEPGGEAVGAVTLKLARSGVLAGRVRDPDTGKPLRLLTVRALRSHWVRGHRQLEEEQVAFTDDDGFFRAEVPPGGYLIEIRKRTPDSEADPASPKRYPVLVWPAGEPETAGISVLPGVEANTGTIDMARIVPAKVQVQLPSSCFAGTSYQSKLFQRAGGALLPLDSLPAHLCDGAIAIPQLAPGSYRFSAEIFAPSGRTLAATADFSVTEGDDLKLEAEVTESVTLTVRIACECEKPLDLAASPIRVLMPPSDFEVNAESCSVPRFPPGPKRVLLRNLPEGLFAKSIAWKSPESLEITLSDRPATVSGTAPPGQVIAALWPLRQEGDGYPEFQAAGTGENGGYTISNLTPGEYRITAVNPEEWLRKDEPGVVEGWLEKGEKFSVEAKENKTVNLTAKRGEP
jgi:hypothetical protein